MSIHSMNYAMNLGVRGAIFELIYKIGNFAKIPTQFVHSRIE